MGQNTLSLTLCSTPPLDTDKGNPKINDLRRRGKRALSQLASLKKKMELVSSVSLYLSAKVHHKIIVVSHIKPTLELQLLHIQSV